MEIVNAPLSQSRDALKSIKEGAKGPADVLNEEISFFEVLLYQNRDSLIREVVGKSDGDKYGSETRFELGTKIVKIPSINLSFDDRDDFEEKSNLPGRENVDSETMYLNHGDDWQGHGVLEPAPTEPVAEKLHQEDPLERSMSLMFARDKPQGTEPLPNPVDMAFAKIDPNNSTGIKTLLSLSDYSLSFDGDVKQDYNLKTLLNHRMDNDKKISTLAVSVLWNEFSEVKDLSHTKSNLSKVLPVNEVSAGSVEIVNAPREAASQWDHIDSSELITASSQKGVGVPMLGDGVYATGEFKTTKSSKHQDKRENFAVNSDDVHLDKRHPQKPTLAPSEDLPRPTFSTRDASQSVDDWVTRHANPTYGSYELTAMNPQTVGPFLTDVETEGSLSDELKFEGIQIGKATQDSSAATLLPTTEPFSERRDRAEVRTLVIDAVKSAFHTFATRTGEDVSPEDVTHRLIVKVVSEAERLEIRFSSENAQTLDLLTRNKSYLDMELRRLGVEQFSFSFDHQNHSQERVFKATESSDDAATVLDEPVLQKSHQVYEFSGLDRLI